MAGPAWPSLRRGPKLIQSHRLVRWLHTASWSRHFVRLTSVFCIIARTQSPAGAGLRRRTHSDGLRGFKSSPHKSALNLGLTLPALHCTDGGYEPMPPTAQIYNTVFVSQLRGIGLLRSCSAPPACRCGGRNRAAVDGRNSRPPQLRAWPSLGGAR